MKNQISKYQIKQSAVKLSAEFSNVPQWLAVASHANRLLIEECLEDYQIAFRLASEEELTKHKEGLNITFEFVGSTCLLEFVHLGRDLNWYPFNDTTPEDFAKIYVLGILFLYLSGNIVETMTSIGVEAIYD